MSSEGANVKYLIGQGSFGKVYRYRYGNQQYAVKKIFKDSKNHPQLISQIQAEGKIMRILSKHRNVVSCYDELNKGQYVYLLNQLVPDGDLRKIDFLPSQDDMWEIVMQLSIALHYLRKKNIIHRDIKPQNILMKKVSLPGGETQVILKLTDFGLAKVIQENQFIQGIAGSPIYLAPQMCNYDQYNFQIDVWSLGITLFQIINNQQSPYHEQINSFIKERQGNYNQKQLFRYLMSLIQTKPINCNSAYPEINKLINSMLQKNPQKRITPFQILCHPKIIQKLIQFNKRIKNNLFENMIYKIHNKQEIIGKEEKQNSPYSSNMELQKNTRKQSMQLAYTPSIDSLQIFLSSRLSNSIISQLNSNKKYEVSNCQQKKNIYFQCQIKAISN